MTYSYVVRRNNERPVGVKVSRGVRGPGLLQIAVRLSESSMRAIDARAKREGTSVSTQIRRIVDRDLR